MKCHHKIPKSALLDLYKLYALIFNNSINLFSHVGDDLRKRTIKQLNLCPYRHHNMNTSLRTVKWVLVKLWHFKVHTGTFQNFSQHKTNCTNKYGDMRLELASGFDDKHSVNNEVAVLLRCYYGRVIFCRSFVFDFFFISLHRLENVLVFWEVTHDPSNACFYCTRDKSTRMKR